MSNYPDGWSRSDEIAAGIAEEVPGFEDHFEAFVEGMDEDYYSLPLGEQERIYESEMESYRREKDEAHAEYAIEQEQYEPW
jgi:hypothetical protein